MWDKADRAIDQQTGRRAPLKAVPMSAFAGPQRSYFVPVITFANVSDKPQVDGASDAFVKLVLSGSVVASVTC